MCSDLLRLSNVEVDISDKKVPPPIPDPDKIFSLRERRHRFRWDHEGRSNQTTGCCTKLIQALTFKKFQLPFLLPEVEYVNNAFGSGVAEYFKQMRWLMIVNLATFVLWFGLVIFPWLIETPLNDSYLGWNPSVTPTDKTWWHRDDLGWDSITGIFGKDSFEASLCVCV